MARSVEHVPWWANLLTWPIAMGLKLWWWTLRIEIDADLEALLKRLEGKSKAVLLWHNRLFVMPYMNAYINRKDKRKVYGLISASGDGAMLSAFLNRIGIGGIRGSSSFRGVEALKEVSEVLKGGADVAITPDGPRGPMYDFKAGVVLAAKYARVPLVLMSCKFTKAKRLGSWDGFYIPYPFSKVTLRAEVIDSIEDLGEDMSNQALARELQQRLVGLTEDL